VRGDGEQGEVEFSLELPADGIGERLAATLRAAAGAQRDFLMAGLGRLAVWRRNG
jgi:hypothetical protein